MALTKVLAGEGAPHNVLVNGLLVGNIQSNQWVVRHANEGKGRSMQDFYAEMGKRIQEAAGEVMLKKGRTQLHYRIRPIPDADKPELLKAYLDRFKTTVQRYFPVPAGSPPQAFAELAENYPVFELLPK